MDLATAGTPARAADGHQTTVTAHNRGDQRALKFHLPGTQLLLGPANLMAIIHLYYLLTIQIQNCPNFRFNRYNCLCTC